MAQGKSVPVVLGAIAMIVIGLVIFVPAGLCTSIVFGFYDASSGKEQGILSWLLFLVPLMVFGTGLAGLGIWLLLRK